MPEAAAGLSGMDPKSYGLCLALRCAPEVSDMIAAFAPGAIERGSQANLLLRFRTGALADALHADPAWGVSGYLAQRQPVSVRTPKGRRYFDPVTRTLAMLEGDSGTLVIEDPEALPPWVRAAPGLRVIDWWATANGMLATHACAVVIGGKAILCVGPSGSGKSTLAVDAALHGYGFIGDDYVLVDPTSMPGGVYVHPLYRSAKLMPARLPAGLDALPWLPADDREDKHVYLLPESQCHGSAQIVAVVAPHIARAAFPELREVRGSDIVRHAAPSILKQLSGDEPQKLAALARIAGALPCHTLALADDGRRNLAALEALVTRLTAANA
ncbi:MAG: hypothetical protein WCL10_20110 [Novosphingobium sp.]|jgi:hypothetical protein|uniref:hypothetical protein n=1 Tax=Novosphingobium sp. TaxID=1874826 RepID=UPI0030175624